MKSGTSHARSIRRTGFLFILPVLAYFIALYWYPLLEAFNMSFKEMLPRMQMQYAGFKAYGEVLSDPQFWNSFGVTFVLTIESTLVTVGLAFVLAFAIYNVKSAGFRDSFVILFVVPSLVSFAAAGLIWEWIMHPRFGLANQILACLGSQSAVQFLSSEKEVIPSMAAINIWVRTGFSMLIILAGLQSIPDSYFEAARVDGARGLKFYWFIVFPLLLPQIASVTLLEVISGLKIFDVVYVTTQGGPNGASSTLMLYLYDNAFRFFRTDKAAVTAVIIFVCLMIFSVIQRRSIEGKRYEL